MPPVDENVAEHDDEQRLPPPRHARDPIAKTARRRRPNPRLRLREHPEHRAVEEQVLPEHEAQVRPPVRPEEPLAGLGGVRELEWTEYQEQRQEAQARVEDGPRQLHACALNHRGANQLRPPWTMVRKAPLLSNVPLRQAGAGLPVRPTS